MADQNEPKQPTDHDKITAKLKAFCEAIKDSVLSHNWVEAPDEVLRGYVLGGSNHFRGDKPIDDPGLTFDEAIDEAIQHAKDVARDAQWVEDENA